ncbi:MAG: class I SAM-dependent methyltransferase [Gemmatimonadales bacterium]
MSSYEFLRDTWRLLPEGLRRNEQLRMITQPVADLFREHKQGVYHAGYFQSDVEQPAVAASQVISQSICDDLRPRRVVDIGCGSGALLAALAARGVETIGLEYADAARDVARGRNVDARPFDVRFDTFDPSIGSFDVACCTEVAEHLPAKYADRLVDTLASAGRTVVFTAATPGQGGTDHVNEQPNEYWIERFLKRGYSYDESLTRRWREDWKTAGIADWYWKNVMVFSSAETTGTR